MIRRLLPLFALMLLTGSSAALAQPLPDGALLRFGSSWLRHDAQTLVFTPDNTLLSVAPQGDAIAWNLTDHQQTTLLALDDPAWTGAFNSANKAFYITHDDHTVRVFDSNTLKERKRFGPFGDTILNSINVAPDGKHLLLVTDHSVETGQTRRTKMGRRPVRAYTTTLRIIDAHSGDVRHTLTFDDTLFRHARFTADSERIIVLDDNTLRTLFTASGEVDAAVPLGRSFDKLALQPGTNRAAIGAWDVIHIIDATSAETLHTLEGLDHITDFIYSPDGKLLAACDFTGEVKIWDTTTHTLLTTATLSEGVNTIAFSPDANQLAIATSDTQVRLWNFRTEAKPVEPNDFGLRGAAHVLGFSPDGKTLLAASRYDDNRILHGSTNDGSLTHTRTLPTIAWAEHVTARGDLIGVDPYDAELTRYSPSDDTQTPPFELEVHQGRLPHGPPVQKLTETSFANNHAAFYTADETVEVRTFPAGDIVVTYTSAETAGTITAIGLSLDGTLLAIGGYEPSLDLYTIAGGHTAIPIERGFPDHLVFSPDNTLLLSDNRLIPLDNPSDIHTLEPMGPIYAVAFSPDSSRVALGGQAGAIRIYDTRSAELLTTRTGHTHDITALAFAPDGKTFASGAEDGSVMLWATP